MKQLACVLATWILGMAGPTGAADLNIRQNHLFFEFGHDEGRVVCGIQEIVVVLAESEHSTPFELAIPKNAERVRGMPVPPIMPGAEQAPALRDEEMEISAGRILIKRRLASGKNTFSFGYVIPAGPDDSVKIEKDVLIPTFLLAAFAPKVRNVTSRRLEVEPADDGYRILGRDLKAGESIDIVFEGAHEALAGQPERRDGAGMESGQPLGGAPIPARSAARLYLYPSIAGAILAVLIFAYGLNLKKRRASTAEFRRFLMDEIEAIDEAAEKKEIPGDYYKRKKKSLMERLRGLGP
ncbi:hypothetical protein HY522_05660 [bacterium]|nr:hypothetical protein [bacterium]